MQPDYRSKKINDIMKYMKEKKEEKRMNKEIQESKEYYVASYDGQVREVLPYLRV
jgi:hypothetical protein